MNNIHLTFDYELFFGERTGTVEQCMVRPTNMLADLAHHYDVRFIFFVDAGMLRAMRNYSQQYRDLKISIDTISRQLNRLAEAGHSIQLHIHPHWQDSQYTGTGWHMGTDRYRLDQFSDTEIEEIVRDYKGEVERVTERPVYAFRAGGLCIQPFSRIGPALRANGIHIDSSVFRGGVMHSKSHQFDFTAAPAKTTWKFDEDPCVESAGGYFTEYPIFPFRYSQIFFAGMAIHRLTRTECYLPFGDGCGMVGDAARIASVLLNGSNDMASLDGYRSGRLLEAFERFNTHASDGHFVAIGHPKALSRKSFEMISALASRHAHAITLF